MSLILGILGAYFLGVFLGSRTQRYLHKWTWEKWVLMMMVAFVCGWMVFE